MYAILVLQLHYPPKYVLDEMESYEISTAFKYGYYAYKDVWEANRLNAYVTAQVNSTHQLSLQGIVTFPWEKLSSNDNPDTKITKSDIDRLKRKAKLIEQNLFRNGTIHS